MLFILPLYQCSLRGLLFPADDVGTGYLFYAVSVWKGTRNCTIALVLMAMQPVLARGLILLVSASSHLCWSSLCISVCHRLSLRAEVAQLSVAVGFDCTAPVNGRQENPVRRTV